MINGKSLFIFLNDHQSVEGAMALTQDELRVMTMAFGAMNPITLVMNLWDRLSTQEKDALFTEYELERQNAEASDKPWDFGLCQDIILEQLERSVSSVHAMSTVDGGTIDRYMTIWYQDNAERLNPEEFKK